jgi:DNA topoisomerase-1
LALKRLCCPRQLHYEEQSQKRKDASKEEKLARKEANAKLAEKYGYAMLDGHR